MSLFLTCWLLFSTPSAEEVVTVRIAEARARGESLGVYYSYGLFIVKTEDYVEDVKGIEFLLLSDLPVKVKYAIIKGR